MFSDRWSNDGQLLERMNSAIASIRASGVIWYVDSDNGNDGNDGLSWSHAKKSMDYVIGSSNGIIAANGTVCVRGDASFSETVTTASDVPNVKIIGMYNSIRRPIWVSGAGGSSCLKIRSSNWEIHHMRFSGATNTVPLVMIDRGGGSYNGNGSVINKCYFHGGGDSHSAVCYNGGSIQNTITDNHFTDFVYSYSGSYEGAVWGSSYSPQSAGHFKITGNWFSENTSHLRLQAFTSLVCHNHFQAEGNVVDATIILDLVCSGADVGGNIVSDNDFGDIKADIDNSAGYYGTTNDLWTNNHCEDGDDSGVPAAT